MKAKIVCPVNIGFNEYDDRIICEIDLPNDIDSAKRVALTIMSAIVKDAQMMRWGIAARIPTKDETITIYGGY